MSYHHPLASSSSLFASPPPPPPPRGSGVVSTTNSYDVVVDAILTTRTRTTQKREKRRRWSRTRTTRTKSTSSSSSSNERTPPTAPAFEDTRGRENRGRTPRRRTTPTLDASLSKATQVTTRQMKEMSTLQAKCFFTPILGPNSPLDQLSMLLFQGDVHDTLMEKFKYVEQDRFAPLAVTRKNRMRNGETTTETRKDGSISDTGIVGVAEVSIQRDVLIGRSIMKFKDLEEANSEYAYVSCMCVDEEYRKMGVATDLLRESEIVAKKWGFDLLCLHCYEDNIPGISLYKQVGYEEVLTDMSLKSPLDILLRKRKVLMCKDL